MNKRMNIKAGNFSDENPYFWPFVTYSSCMSHVQTDVSLNIGKDIFNNDLVVVLA